MRLSRPLEHQIGEQVGQPQLTFRLVADARGELHAEGDGGQAGHALPHHLEPIGEGVQEVVGGQLAL